MATRNPDEPFFPNHPAVPVSLNLEMLQSSVMEARRKTKHKFQIYIDIHIYKKKKKKSLKILKRSFSKHDNKYNNLDHSVDINISGILSHTKPENRSQQNNNSNFTDCSTVHGVSSSHHVHTNTCTRTHCVLNTDSSSLAAKNSTHPTPPINKHSLQINSTQSHSLRGVCVRVLCVCMCAGVLQGEMGSCESLVGSHEEIGRQSTILFIRL